MVYSSAEQMLIREDIFRWLDEQMVHQGTYALTRDLLQTYRYKGENIKLLDTSRGIWNPRQLDVTLTVMTSSKANTGYNDEIQANGLIRYSLEKAAPDAGSNTKLLKAMYTGAPLVYFKGLKEGGFEANYPVYIKSFDPIEKAVYLEPDDTFKLFADPIKLAKDHRAYVDRIVKTRQHQRFFRAEVMGAYKTKCSVCELNQYSLIDAAHIVPDADEAGIADVTNGLALCKLHHTAYDRDILGISPDYKIQIRSDILSRVDESISLTVNFIDLNGKQIELPSTAQLRPNPEFLEKRFETFIGSS